MLTLEEIDKFIEQKKAELDELKLQEEILSKRVNILNIKKPPELERQAFDMLSPEEQEVLRNAYKSEQAGNATNVSARAMYARSRSRIMV